MSLFSRLLDPSNLPKHSTRIDVVSPITGVVSRLDDSSSTAYQHRIFGEGALVQVSGFHVKAPFDCVIEEATQTANRLRLRDKHGLRLQIQCGVDSHQLYGEGFKRWVKRGQKVKAGQILIEFDLRKLKLSLADSRFAVTVLNSDKTKGILLESKNVTADEDILFSVLV